MKSLAYVVNIVLILSLLGLCVVSTQNTESSTGNNQLVILHEYSEEDDPKPSSLVPIPKSSLIREDEDNLLIISTVEGNIYAIDSDTGEERWNLQTKKPLVSTKHNNSPTLIPGLGGDSSIFYLDEQHKLQKLPVSISQMVELAPFQSGDLLYVGNKETSIYVIDRFSGTVLNVFTKDGSIRDPEICPTFEIPEGAIFIGRADYTIRALDAKTGAESWNVTTGEFIYSLSNFYGQSNKVRKELTSPFNIVGDAHGSIYCIDAISGRTKWNFDSGTQIASIFSMEHGEVYRPKTVSKSSLALPVYVGHLESTGLLYAIENPPFALAEPRMLLITDGKNQDQNQSHLPRASGTIGSEESENSCTRDDLEFPTCLIGFHNISERKERVSFIALPAGVVSPSNIDEKTPEGLTWSQIIIICLGILLSSVSLVLFWVIYRKEKKVPEPEPVSKTPKKKKKPKKEQQQQNSEQSDPGVLRIGKLEIQLNNILGYGSSGTIVYEGTLDGRKVAVKRMLVAFYKLAQREINLLLESDTHNNVVTYYAKEEDKEFIYLALSYCPRTLADLIEGPDSANLNDLLIQNIMFELAKGLAHLHSLNIVHTDIKPQNILLDSRNTVKISDMGLAKKLEVNQSSFSDNGSGSFGWQAPEIVLGKLNSINDPNAPKPSTRVTKKVDIFSMGCLMYYVITKSHHPFGDRIEREMNVRNGNFNLDRIKNDALAYDLILQMIAFDPERRPDVNDILIHPFFWSDSQRLLFLKDASDRLEIEKGNAQIVLDFEADVEDIIGPDWKLAVDPRLIENLGKYRKYNTSLRDVLRLIRNKSHHYRDLPEELQLVIGPPPGQFLKYFLNRFPRLFVHTYALIRKYCRDEPTFKHYFKII